MNPQFKEGISNAGLSGVGEGVLWLDIVHMLKDIPGNSKGTAIDIYTIHIKLLLSVPFKGNLFLFSINIYKIRTFSTQCIYMFHLTPHNKQRLFPPNSTDRLVFVLVSPRQHSCVFLR